MTTVPSEDVTRWPGLGVRALGAGLMSYHITEECAGAVYSDNCLGGVGGNQSKCRIVGELENTPWVQ